MLIIYETYSIYNLLCDPYEEIIANKNNIIKLHKMNILWKGKFMLSFWGPE